MLNNDIPCYLLAPKEPNLHRASRNWTL